MADLIGPDQGPDGVLVHWLKDLGRNSSSPHFFVTLSLI
jgi:hypothetical protein